MRRRSRQDHVPLRVLRNVTEKSEPLVLRATAVAARTCGGVRLIDDYKIWGVVQEALPVPVRLDEIYADDQVAVVPVQRDIAPRKSTLQPADPRRLDHGCLDVELGSQLFFPLLAQVRGAENADAAHDATVQQLAGDHGRLYGLAHAHVVRDEQTHRIEPERHDERNKLVGAGRYRQPPHGTERPSAASQTEAYGVSKQQRAVEVSGRFRVGPLVFRRLESFRLQWEIYPHSVSVGAVNWPESHYVRLLGWQDHPISAAGMDQRSGDVLACGRHYESPPMPAVSTTNLGTNDTVLTAML